MRRLLAVFPLLASLGCAPSARDAGERAFTIPREGPLPAFALQTLFYRKEPDGSLAGDTPIGVLLTRPVSTPLSLRNVLSLVDQNDKVTEGTIESADAQLLVFRPNNPWPRGKALRLMLTVPVRAEDGATLPAGELAKLHTQL